ncbi:MAG: DUF4388 domain-containing protein [Deltaproteobacteria bacterium]|nr:DUF4388 domain-containing protein [Deltaproteobacteria bacterium]
MAKPHLLLVDSDPTSFRVLEVSFRKAGFLVTTATSGREALEKVATSNPDVIISETKLPEVDGFEFCRRVKAHPEWSQIPFVFLSNQTSLESKIHGLELGVEDYLTKPIFVREILTRVRILLQRRDRDRIEHREAKTKVSGSLAEMGFVDIIQTIELGRKTGQLRVTLGPRTAVVTFRDGQILDAEYGPLRGERAVYRLFQAVEGFFELDFGDVDAPSRITQTTQALLMEGMLRIDQWVRFEEQLPSFDKVIEVDYTQLGNRLSELPDDANPLLKLIDGKRTLRQVIEECELDEIASLNLISKLFFEAILTDEGRPREPSSEMSLQSLQGWVEGTPNVASGAEPAPPAASLSPFAAPVAESAIPVAMPAPPPAATGDTPLLGFPIPPFVAETTGPYDKTVERAAATNSTPVAAKPAAESEVSGDWHVARLDTAGMSTVPEIPRAELPPFATDTATTISPAIGSTVARDTTSAPFDPDDLIGSHAAVTTVSPRPSLEATTEKQSAEREHPLAAPKNVSSEKPADDDAKTEERPRMAMVPLGGALDDDDSFFKREDSGVRKEPSGLYRHEDSSLFDKDLGDAGRGMAPKWIALSLGALVIAAGGVFFALKGDGDKKPDGAALARAGLEARSVERRTDDERARALAGAEGADRKDERRDGREEARAAERVDDEARRRTNDETAAADTTARRERDDGPREGAREAVARRDEPHDARGEERGRRMVEREGAARDEGARARAETEDDVPARRREARDAVARAVEARREDAETRRDEVTERVIETPRRRDRRVARATTARAEAAREERRRERAARVEAREESDVDRLLKEGRKLVARGRYKKAVDPLQKVVAAKPTAEAHYLLGEAYFELSKEGPALDQLEKATAMGSRRGKAFMMLGSLYSSAGKKAKARGAFEQYLKVEPRGKFAADAKAMLGQN